ncbi:MAG TPA: VOC family protein, partial [Candidatus Thermoplasmatota archaeon]|nr:VOC family protein [Candidatus Thermoplasmatota archaeon]
VTSASKDDETGMTTYADLDLEGAELGLGHIPSNDDPAFRAWVGTPLGAGVVVYVTVPDVDGIHARAVKAGATIEYPLRDRPYGRIFTLNDPDGYTVTFLQERRAPARKAARKGAKKAARKAKAAKKGRAAKRRS